ARTTPRCSAGTWATVERNGLVWLWYHALGAAPDVEVPAMREHEHPEWTRYRRYDWVVNSHAQEMGENSADSAHFLYVHGTMGVPEVTSEVTPEGVFHAVNRSKNKRFGKVVSTAVDIRIYFPGLSVIRFDELAEVTLLATNTPVDEERVEQRFFFTARRK